jgi:hypothetical protein
MEPVLSWGTVRILVGAAAAVRAGRRPQSLASAGRRRPATAAARSSADMYYQAEHNREDAEVEASARQVAKALSRQSNGGGGASRQGGSRRHNQVVT